MKIKNIVKIILDAVMMVLFAVILFFVEDAGLVFHEIVGLSVVFLVGLHLVLNWQWIVNTTKNIGKKKINAKTLWMYFLNVTLLISIIVITTTGIMISRVVLPLDGHNTTIEHIHICGDYVIGFLLILHIAQHIKYLKSSVKAIRRNFKMPIIRRTFIGAFTILLMLVIFYYGIISTVSKNFDGDIFLEEQPTIKGSQSEPKNPQ